MGEQANAPNGKKIKSFIITGHSLGAGAAAVLTMMVADCIDQLRELSNNPNFKVHCYGYAPVASVSHDLSEKYKDHIDSFVCHDDLVARLSYGTATCAKELIMDSVIAVDGLGGSTKVNNNASIRKECFDILQTRRKEIYHNKEPRYPLLYVPGNVYQFRRSGGSGSSSSSKVTPSQDIKLPGTNQQETPVREKRRSIPASFLSTHSSSEPVLPHPPVSLDSKAVHTNKSTDSVSFSLHRSSPMISEEVLISKTCLEDHMVVTYLTAFQTARQDCMRQDSFRRKTAHQQSTKSSTLKHSPSSSKIANNFAKVDNMA